MKSVLLALCVSSMAVHIHGHVSPVAESFKSCLVESGMSRADFIEALQSSNDTKAQCIAACTMEKEQFMDNETININAIIAKMEDVSQEIGKQQITDLVNSCASNAIEQTEGKCGIAHSVVRCIHDELRKEGWI